MTVAHCGTERPTSALLQKERNISGYETDGKLRDISWDLWLSVTLLRMTEIRRLNLFIAWLELGRKEINTEVFFFAGGGGGEGH